MRKFPSLRPSRVFAPPPVSPRLVPFRLALPGLVLPCLAFLCLVVTACLPAAAQSGSDSAKSSTPAKPAENAAAEKSPDKDKLPPLPPDAHVQQSIQLDGKKLTYTVTIGTLPVRDQEGKLAGELVYTSYTVDEPNRPVTFAVNGGPGASSVFLNFGAIGPKHLHMGNEGDSPSDPASLSDNPGTWLGFSDLVFLDPIGTGFSRSLVSLDQTKKLFWSTEPDIDYLSRAIYDWLVRNDRLQSRKYLVGESYGGFRGPRITWYLQSQLGVAMNGVVLVSPYLNPTIEANGDLSPIPWMVTLPSITAANLERQGKLTPEAMQSVISYTLGDYAETLIKGNSDPAATDAMIKKVTEMTGLDPEFVKFSGGRLETQAYLREVHREQGKVGSVYDSNVTMFDPFPYSPEDRANDPLLATLIAPTTTAMVDFDTRVVGWKIDARYNALSYDVNRNWSRDQDQRAGSATQLRDAVAADPKLRVLIAHGWNDLSCPFMGSILTVNQCQSWETPPASRSANIPAATCSIPARPAASPCAKTWRPCSTNTRDSPSRRARGVRAANLALHRGALTPRAVVMRYGSGVTPPAASAGVLAAARNCDGRADCPARIRCSAAPSAEPAP